MIQYNNSNPDYGIAAYEGGDDDFVINTQAVKESGPSENDMDNALNTLKMIENRYVDTSRPEPNDIVEDSYKFPIVSPRKVDASSLIIEEDDEITKLANEIKNLGVVDENDEFSPFELGGEMNKDGL